MTKQTAIKIAIFAALVIAFVLLYPYIKEYASLEFIKQKRIEFQEYYQDNKVLVLSVFFVGYVAVTALSLPGAAIMTLLAGALFGLAAGVILVSFASSIGATLAFLVARFLLGESLQKKYGDKLKKINEGVEKEGKFYLFTMRLIPAFPFFLINILMGLTRIPALSFYWVSQLGMFAGTVVFVYAGTALAQVESIGDVLSPQLIAAFVAWGFFRWRLKKQLNMSVASALRRLTITKGNKWPNMNTM